GVGVGRQREGQEVIGQTRPGEWNVLGRSTQGVRERLCKLKGPIRSTDDVIDLVIIETDPAASRILIEDRLSGRERQEGSRPDNGIRRDSHRLIDELEVRALAQRDQLVTIRRVTRRGIRRPTAVRLPYLQWDAPRQSPSYRLT